MIDMSHPFIIPATAAAAATEDRSAEAHVDAMTESFWLKEAKATLRVRDPLDAANDVEALANWADLRCGDILKTSSARLRGDQHG